MPRPRRLILLGLFLSIIAVAPAWAQRIVNPQITGALSWTGLAGTDPQFFLSYGLQTCNNDGAQGGNGIGVSGSFICLNLPVAAPPSGTQVFGASIDLFSTNDSPTLIYTVPYSAACNVANGANAGCYGVYETLGTGAASQGFMIGTEIDLANFTCDPGFGGVGRSCPNNSYEGIGIQVGAGSLYPSDAAFVVTPNNPAYPVAAFHCGFCLFAAQTVDDDAFYDASAAATSIAIAGSHHAGIDASAAQLSGPAINLGLGQTIAWGTADQLAGLPGGVAINGAVTILPSPTPAANGYPAAGLSLGWNHSGGGGEADLFASIQGGSTGGFAFYAVTPAGAVANGGNPVLSLDRHGHVASVSAAPAVVNCGTAPSITGTDTKGIVTMGGGAPNVCTLRFAHAYASIPACVVTAESAAITPYIAAKSTTAFTIQTPTAHANAAFDYICLQ